jgi:enterochelin esterase-like enzyme
MTQRRMGWLMGLSVVLATAGVMWAGTPGAAPATEAATFPSFPVPPQGFEQVREGIDKGKVERVEYDAPAVGADVKRWMQIYTPPGYSKDKKYPVFYLIHGAGQDERVWVNEGRAHVILDNLLADKKIVPMIVVFPNGSVAGGGGGGGGPGGGRGAGRGGAGRGDAATGPAGAATGPGGARAGGGRRGGGGGGGMGGGNSFETDLIKDLIPYVEAHYSVLADAQHRALAGLSMGGMQTKAIAPGNSDKFAYFGIFSGGNLSPTTDITDMETFKKNVKLVYMSFGSREASNARGAGGLPSGPVGIQREAEALNKAGVKAVYYVSPNSAHDFTSWKRSLYYMSQLLFQ